MTKKLVFAQNINKEGLSGLIEAPKKGELILFCYCSREVAEEILLMQKQISDNNILMYEQQLLGFYHERDNKDYVIGLINAMGMSYDEWQVLKKIYGLEYIPQDSFDEIDDYFINKNKLE